MKKDISTVVAEAVREEMISYVKLGIKYIIFVVLFAYLIFNIQLSQSIHPLYGSFITEDINSAVELTKKTRYLPEAKEIRSIQSQVYGPEFDNIMASDETAIQQKIDVYQQALAQNPKSRDVLYNLYLLYKYNADPRAEEYLQKAQAIDPMVTASHE